MYTPTDCMLMHSLLSLTVCGGIGVITPMAGAAILTMVGEVTLLIIATVAGELAGAASMAAGIGDGDTIIIITIIPVADIGEVATGAEVVCIQTDALMETAYLPEIVYPVHLQPVVRQEQVVIRLVVVQALQVEK